MSVNTNQDDVARVIVLVRGMMENKSSFYWCYVAVKPSRYDEFKHAISNKYNIQNFPKDGYGEVIVSGAGREPAKIVTEKVAEMFGVPAGSLFTDSNPIATLTKTIAEIAAAAQS